MIWGVVALGTNIGLNAGLMYGADMGVEGAAWASVAARGVTIIIGVAVIRFKKIKVGFQIWTLFNVSMHVRKLFWKRWLYFMAIFTVTFFITYRNHFYGVGYPAGTLKDPGLGVGVGGLSVIGLTSAIMSIFQTTFAAIVAMASVFVGSELGKGNIDQAKINADEIKGFNTTMAVLLAACAAILGTFVQHMGFLSETKYATDGSIKFDSISQLRQVQYSIYVIASFYPIWIWFTSSYRMGNSGGKGGKFAFVDWIISGPIQLGWLAIITLLIVPHSPILQDHFALTYLLFFISDLLKLLFQEILYYKYKWLHSITKEAENQTYGTVSKK